jgi:hypothetical protein
MRAGTERGSTLLLVLFACLAVAVVVQTLTAVLVCAERTAVDESSGRQWWAEKEEGLRWLRGQASLSWTSLGWQEMPGGPEDLEGSLEAVASEAGAGWLMEAAVRQPAVSRMTVYARAERGRDGIDLPLAALVAGEVVTPGERTEPWLEAGSSQRPARAFVVRTPAGAGLGPDCVLATLDKAWHLDDGWRRLAEQWVEWTRVPDASVSGGIVSGRAGGVAPGPRVLVMSGGPGQTLSLGGEADHLDPLAPVLVVVVGGAALDLRGRGDLCGVVVVDGGGVLLDGTRVRGAVFVTGVVDVGRTGGVVFGSDVLRWAADRSLSRVRLVPGSRRETIG